ncbi:MAG: hypothetical protein ACU0CC_20745 [Sagittula sp.]|mgnify:CR=1 FL=1|jgi:predicted membrane-bound mannosyltransferase|uniref:hypothetical protein n=1 Tax=unclassified Sagittula TaxID=2624628 RepID=UPI000C2D4E8A|nr:MULTISPECIES: hypothetical protein [unclassified Sagittula]AUC55002.1 hypothetical protein CDO87_18310 [Sagittula sp. P11]WHZ33606.1 hypothetical protein QNI11_13215 [Sagittula sp. MA-2]
MKRLRDELLVYNERIKLVATSLNAIALGLLGFAVLRPATDTALSLELSSLWWAVIALAFHALSHYMLGRLHKESADDSL